MNKNTFEIIQAQSSDLEDVFELVRELALYEKEPESVTTDIQEYRKCFEKGEFEVILAQKEGVTIGIALYYTTFSTWKGRMMYLEDFVVKEEFRKTGVGGKLFDRFIQIAKQRDARLVKWQVLDWNQPAIDFYEKRSAEIEKNWYNGKIVF